MTGALENLHLSTLLCFVLIEKSTGRHAFCSRYDFGPWPLLQSVSSAQLDHSALAAIHGTRAVMLNGFVFDELRPDVVVQLTEQARADGAALFFDLGARCCATTICCCTARLANNAHASTARVDNSYLSNTNSCSFRTGPRASTLVAGERRAALDAVLDAATVITMTADEAAQITGESDARAACMHLLARPSAVATWVIVKLGVEGAVLAEAPRGRKRTHLREGDVRFVQQHAFSVPVEDTVGCGDSFAAAVRYSPAAL